MISFRIVAQFAVAALLLASCASHKSTAVVLKNGKTINPFAAGTYEHFKADPSYPKTYGVWKNDALLGQTNAENSSLFISLAKQRGFLMNGDEVVLDYPICSGIPVRPTPTGTFYILEKIVEKKSNKYGHIYDATGVEVNNNADLSMDVVPAGGRFEGASMRYWMRLTHDGVGHHIGPVKRRPASHACVRGPSATMPIVYSKVKEGTRVIIE